MKKIVWLLTALIFLALGYITFEYKGDFSWIVTIAVFATLFLSYFYFEKNSMGSKEIALIATMSTFGGLGRVLFASLPYVKPTTFIVAVSGLVFGPYEGFLVGSTSAFISNIFLGQGPWTPWQMFAWGVVGFISGILGKRHKFSAEVFSFICFFYGFMFDWIMNLWFVLGYVKPLTFTKIFLAYLASFNLDIIHAASSFVFCMIFYSKFYKILSRFKKRLEFSLIKENL